MRTWLEWRKQVYRALISNCISQCSVGCIAYPCSRYLGSVSNIKTLSYQYRDSHYQDKIDRLLQERRNSIANALELRLSCTNPSRWSHRLIFVIGIPIPRKDCLYIERGPAPLHTSLPMFALWKGDSVSLRSIMQVAECCYGHDCNNEYHYM